MIHRMRRGPKRRSLRPRSTESPPPLRRDPGAESVAVFGSGIAGLTAAHELAERGFSVELYEARPVFGGKSRTQPVVGSGRDGRADLPGEHGFRFFPAFYRHVIDTMERIPDSRGGASVAEHLVPSPEAALGRADDQPVFRFLRRLPREPGEMAQAVLGTFRALGFTTADTVRFTERLLRYYTSCAERRRQQYEPISWWEYLQGESYSPAFRKYLASIPRIMVAMDARLGSARTLGDVSMQLFLDYGSDGSAIDRLLDGPTSEVWLDPWRAHLSSLGVRLHAGTPLRSLELHGQRVASARVGDGQTVHADFFVVAVPIEVLRGLVDDALAAAEPQLLRLRAAPEPVFGKLTNWMTGLQLYLRRDVPIAPGHVFYPDSPWGMTTISQPQFWRRRGAFEDRYGDGQVRGLISVDLADWNTPGRFVQRPARHCTAEEVVRETWEQLKCAVNSRQAIVLRDDDLLGYHLDEELEALPGGRGFHNHAPLLVHPPGSWALRPEARTAIDNLALAGDFVRTHTDLASMEGANEAARRAVNAILAQSRRPLSPCPVWPLAEPALFAPARAIDERLFAAGWTGRRHLFDLLPGRLDSVQSLVRAAAGAFELSRRALPPNYSGTWLRHTASQAPRSRTSTSTS